PVHRDPPQARIPLRGPAEAGGGRTGGDSRSARRRPPAARNPALRVGRHGAAGDPGGGHGLLPPSARFGRAAFQFADRPPSAEPVRRPRSGPHRGHMTEELINTLTAIRSLRTVSSTTALTYKGSKKSLPQIAGERDVGAVVEGSVRLSADQVQIEVRLYDARTEKPLWTGTYPGSLRDVLKLENEAARSIADEIRVKLTPAEKRQLASSRPVDSAAWLDYSHGRMSWNRRTPEGIAQAIKFFQASIDKDPGNARAQSGLADAW